MADLKNIRGNYLAQKLGNFPLDCECLNYAQKRDDISQALGCIGGDRVLLSGFNADGSGLVFVKTNECPWGEVMPVKAGSGSTLHLVSEPVRVDFSTEDVFPEAYFDRYLEYGTVYGAGAENFPVASFWKLRSNKVVYEALQAEMQTREAADMAAAETLSTGISKINEAIQAENEAIQAEATARQEADGVLDRKIDSANRRIDAMSGVPMGTVCMWSTVVSTTAPTGWAFCKGQYEMFSDGVRRRVPNMVGRFPMGPTTGYTLGSTGGAFSHSHQLTLSEMPKHTHDGSTNYAGSHSHEFKDAYFAEGQGSVGPYYGSHSGYDKDNELFIRDAYTCSAGDHTHTFNTNPAGGGSAFSINTTPPYYVIEFIIKL